jgi:hypothetical protein
MGGMATKKIWVKSNAVRTIGDVFNMENATNRQPCALLGCVIAGFLSGCVQNADGASYAQLPHPLPGANETKIVLFRDKVFYVVQAPHVVSADVFIDNKLVGSIKNGGYIELTVLPGRHNFKVGAGTTALGSNETMWNLNVPGGITAYFQVWDKTRMEGARAAEGAVTGTVGGGLAGAAAGASNSESLRDVKTNVASGAVGGAVQGGIQGAIAGFRGRVREGEGRVWAVDLVGEAEAMPALTQLARTQ